MHFTIFSQKFAQKKRKFLWILYALFRCSSAFETKGTTDFYLYRKDSAVWHGVLDVFISAFLWVLLKLIVRAFRPRDHDRAADDLSLPLCAKPSTSSYNQSPIALSLSSESSSARSCAIVSICALCFWVHPENTTNTRKRAWKVEHKTFDILASERWWDLVVNHQFFPKCPKYT